MAKYTVRLKATIYYDVDIEAPDQESADHQIGRASCRERV